MNENITERYLFKAKSIHNHNWILGSLSMHKTGKYFIRPIDGNASSSEEVDKNTICQCTGLRDKNGNLIWENDIIDLIEDKGVVKYAGIEPKYTLDLKNYLSIIKVIGDIFDTPELIEEKEAIFDKYETDDSLER